MTVWQFNSYLNSIGEINKLFMGGGEQRKVPMSKEKMIEMSLAGKLPLPKRF